MENKPMLQILSLPPSVSLPHTQKHPPPTSGNKHNQMPTDSINYLLEIYTYMNTPHAIPFWSKQFCKAQKRYKKRKKKLEDKDEKGEKNPYEAYLLQHLQQYFFILANNHSFHYVHT